MIQELQKVGQINGQEDLPQEGERKESKIDNRKQFHIPSLAQCAQWRITMQLVKCCGG